jgi:hypothetical protein
LHQAVRYLDENLQYPETAILTEDFWFHQPRILQCSNKPLPSVSHMVLQTSFFSANMGAVYHRKQKCEWVSEYLGDGIRDSSIHASSSFPIENGPFNGDHGLNSGGIVDSNEQCCTIHSPKHTEQIVLNRSAHNYLLNPINPHTSTFLLTFWHSRPFPGKRKERKWKKKPAQLDQS